MADTYIPEDGGFIHENEASLLDEGSACPKCGKPLKFEFERDFNEGNHWDAKCDCGTVVKAHEGFRITVQKPKNKRARR